MAAEIVGAVSERGLLAELFNNQVRPADAVARVMEESLPMLGVTEPVADAVEVLRSCDALLVLDDGKPVGVLTRLDLLSDINIA
jgi:cystathionine beta-synthase